MRAPRLGLLANEVIAVMGRGFSGGVMGISRGGLVILFTIAALTLFGARVSTVLAGEGYNVSPSPSPGDGKGLLRINMDYYNLAADSGGDFYFWAPGEFAASAFVLALPETYDPIMLEYGCGGSFARSIPFPVDSGMARLRVFVGTQRKGAVVLRRPDGRSVAENPAFASEQKFRHMGVIVVQDPEPGVWRLEFSGAGCRSVSVRYSNGSGGNGGIDLIDMEFVEAGGRPGHEGLFPVKGRVRGGESRLLRIDMGGAISDATVEFVSSDNRLLGRVKLRPSSPETAGELIGSCAVPSVPFRTRVRGRDSRGYPFQRVTPGIYTPAGGRRIRSGSLRVCPFIVIRFEPKGEGSGLPAASPDGGTSSGRV